MNRKSKIVVEVICWLLIILFFFSGLDKFWHYQKFGVELGKNPMLTDLAGFIVWFVPSVEILISIMLRVPATRLFALYASFSLMTMFTTYTVIMMLNYRDVVCSCNGIMESLGWTEHMIVNSLYTLLAVIGVMLEAGNNDRPKLELRILFESILNRYKLFFNP